MTDTDTYESETERVFVVTAGEKGTRGAVVAAYDDRSAAVERAKQEANPRNTDSLDVEWTSHNYDEMDNATVMTPDGAREMTEEEQVDEGGIANSALYWAKVTPVEVL